MPCNITGIDYYLPEKVITNQELCEKHPRWTSSKIEDKIGIKQRHVAKENETALDLALNAAQKIFSHYDRGKIDFVILCTQSPEYYLPTTSCILQDKLGLNKSCGAFDFNLGCSGFIYGLAMSKGLIEGGIANNILLLTSETYSKYLHENDIANRSIFGDGASACIIEKSKTGKIHEFILGTDGRGMNNLIVPNGGARNRLELNPKLITDESGNQWTCNNLNMNGSEIFNFTIEFIPGVVNDVLNKNNITIQDIDFVIFHQANKYMLEYLRKKIKIPQEKFYNQMLNTGNTVSSTIPIALKDCVDNGLIKQGDKILLCGFGVGYSWGATIITI